MIGQANRFHGLGSLNYVYRHGKTAREEHMSIKHALSKRTDYRLAVVVSRKVSKSAVKRNRIRRRIYEVVRIIKKSVNQPWSIDMIITVFDEKLAEIPADELHELIIRLLKKAKTI